MEKYTNTRCWKKKLNWDHQLEEKDKRNSLKGVKLNYPSCQAWRIFSLCTFTLFNAINTWHVLQITQHVNPCYLRKLAEDFQMEEISVRKTLLQRDQERCTGACWCHWSFDRQQTVSSGALATQQLSCRHSQPRQPTHQANCWGPRQLNISEFLKEARSFEKWDESVSFLNQTFGEGKARSSASYQTLKLAMGWYFPKPLKVFGHSKLRGLSGAQLLKHSHLSPCSCITRKAKGN